MPISDIKRRLESTKDTKKITQALQLVAASKMKGYQRRAKASHNFALELVNQISQLKHNWQDWHLAEIHPDGKTVFVLITANKGLCGSLNQKIIKQLFEGELWLDTPANQRVLITIGKKGYEAARKLSIQPEHHLTEIGERITTEQIFKLGDLLIDMFNSLPASSIYLVSAHYINPFAYQTTQKQYLPLSDAMLESHLVNTNPSDTEQFLVYQEPDTSTVRHKLEVLLTHALISQAFYELKAVEYSSRMVAMKKATEAAGERINELVLEYNKSRQAAITQELSEITAATQAQETDSNYA